MVAGITVNDSCLSEYRLLREKQAYKYIIFSLNRDQTEITVAKTSTSQDYDNFIADLPDTECRWGVYTFGFEQDGAGKRSVITFVSWAPDDAKIKEKMLFASSKDALRQALEGIALEVQATSYPEVTYDSLRNKAERAG